MKTIKTYLIIAITCLAINVNAQLRVRTDGSVHQGYAGTVNAIIYFGTYNYQGNNNGKWAVENWGDDFQIWKPWPSPNNGNYKLFIKGDNGFVGIGKIPSYKLDVDGDIATYGNLMISSDERLKTNIAPLTNCMEKINKLNGKSYFKISPKLIVDINTANDTIKYMTMLSDQNKKIIPNNKTQLGLLAQEVNKVFPELVSVDSAGYFSLDYIGLIPVIIEALKEHNNTIIAQSLKIKELSAQLTAIESNPIFNPTGTIKNAKVTIDVPMSDNTTNAFLYQNTPNPFTVNTEIKYFLPESISSATLFIYDMQGLQIKSIPVQQHGNASITLHGSEFRAGMYIYTLIADGKEVDTKRMILTE